MRNMSATCLKKCFTRAFLQARESFVKELHDAEEWLYDEGEDQIKSVYQGKLDSLKVRFEWFLISFRLLGTVFLRTKHIIYGKHE